MVLNSGIALLKVAASYSNSVSLVVIYIFFLLNKTSISQFVDQSKTFFIYFTSGILMLVQLEVILPVSYIIGYLL